MIALLAACALRRVEHYEPVSFPLDPVGEHQLAHLPDAVAGELARGRLRSLATTDGREGPAALDVLPAEALYAVYATLRPWSRGAELDLLVDVGEGPRAVTVWWSTRHDAVVAWGDRPVGRGGEPADLEPERLAERFGLGAFTGEQPWTEEDLADLALALERLSAEEVAALRGIEIQRIAVSPRSATRELAYFDPAFEPPVLQFYDVAFDEGRYGFVGPVEAPSSAAAMTALHEFGHVLADAPLRRAYAAYLDAWRATDGATDPLEQLELARIERERLRTYRSLGRVSPVIEAWQAFRRGRKGPSSSGFRDPHESFAEAFALWHLDPDALERALPGARAWFASGAHLRAAGLVEE